MKRRIILIAVLICTAIFFLQAQYPEPLFQLQRARDTGYIIVTKTYQGIFGQPVYYTVDDFKAMYDIGGSSGGSLDTPFVYLRDMQVGETYSGLSTTVDWINWHRFSPPTLALNLSPTTATYQIGTVNSIDLNTITYNPGGATLGNGYIVRTSPSPNDTLQTWTGTSGSTTISFSPQQSGAGNFNESSYTFRAYQSYSGIESGTAISSSRVLYGVYPVLYFTSDVDYTSSTAGIYAAANLLVQNEGNKSVAYSGTDVFIYYLIPKTWNDFTLSSIIDGNGFNVTGAFTAYDVNISSAGLSNNWTNEPYKMYKLNSLTTVNATYTFNR